MGEGCFGVKGRYAGHPLSISVVPLDCCRDCCVAQSFCPVPLREVLNECATPRSARKRTSCRGPMGSPSVEFILTKTCEEVRALAVSRLQRRGIRRQQVLRQMRGCRAARLSELWTSRTIGRQLLFQMRHECRCWKRGASTISDTAHGFNHLYRDRRRTPPTDHHVLRHGRLKRTLHTP
jgi:hypothetical protein